MRHQHRRQPNKYFFPPPKQGNGYTRFVHLVLLSMQNEMTAHKNDGIREHSNFLWKICWK